MQSDRPPASSHGFTLIEMLVVLAILALVAIIIAPNIGRPPAAITLGHDEARLRSAIVAARRLAVETGKPGIIEVTSVVAGAQLEPTIKDSSNSNELIFFADGSSNGGLISRSGTPLVLIDWLSGEARRAR